MAYYCYDCKHCSDTYKCNETRGYAKYYNNYVDKYEVMSKSICPSFELVKQYCEKCKYYSYETYQCTNHRGTHYNKPSVKGYYIEGRTGDYSKCFESKSAGGILGYFFS